MNEVIFTRLSSFHFNLVKSGNGSFKLRVSLQLVVNVVGQCSGNDKMAQNLSMVLILLGMPGRSFKSVHH